MGSDAMGIVSYAQNFEDVILWRALGHIERGTYIDVGAHDPVVDSVSKAFYERGWRGVHIEPTAFYADLLRADRPDELIIQGAICAEPGLLAFFEIPATGLSTASEEVAEHHRKSGREIRQTTVPALTLDEVFRRIPNETNWLKIDVEGFEREVLAGWRDVDRRPWIVVVESTFPGSQRETHQTWEPIIVGKGYEFAYFDGLNRFYVSDAHPELHAAFRFGPNIFDGFQLSDTSAYLHTIKRRFGESLEGVAAQKLSVERQLEEQRRAHASALVEWEDRVRAVRDEATRAHELAKEEMQSQVQLLSERVVTLAEDFAQAQLVTKQVTLEAGKAQEELMRIFEARLAQRDGMYEERLEQCRHEADIRIHAEINRSAEEEKALRSELSALQETNVRLAREFADREREFVAEAALGQAEARAEIERLLREMARRELAVSEQIAKLQQDGHDTLNKQQRMFFEREALVRSELAGARESLARFAAEAADREYRVREDAKRDVLNAKAEAITQLDGAIERHRADMERFERLQKEAELTALQQLRAGQEREEFLRDEKMRLEIEFRGVLQNQSEERKALQSQIGERDQALGVARSAEVALRAQVAVQAREVRELAARLAWMQETLSWRVTAPLRRLAKWSSRNRFYAAEGDTGDECAAIETPVPCPWPNGDPTNFARPLAEDEASPAGVASEPSSLPEVIAEGTEIQMTTIRHVDELLARCDVAFVEAVYSVVLRRPPDPDGLQYYVSRLRSGEPKDALLAQIATSSEAQSQDADIPGIDEYLRKYRKTRWRFWGRLARRDRLEMTINRIENSLGRLEETMRTQESASVRRLTSLENAVAALPAMQKDGAKSQVIVASSAASPSHPSPPAALNLGGHAQYVLGQLVMQAPGQEEVA